MKIIYKTFQEWKNCGRHVRKGEKSTKRNEDGVCVFSKDQTDETVQNEYYAREPRGYTGWDDDDDVIFGPYF